MIEAFDLSDTDDQRGLDAEASNSFDLEEYLKSMKRTKRIAEGLEQQAGRATDVLPATVAAALQGAMESVESTEQAKAVIRSLWEGYP